MVLPTFNSQEKIMIKKHYQKELSLLRPQARGNTNAAKEVEKIQSWLNLWENSLNPRIGLAVEIDGIFGPATELAVRNFQQAQGLRVSGVVDEEVFAKLTEPLRTAFTTQTNEHTLRGKIVDLAHLHLNQKPLELSIRGETNRGPWVRSYMDGNEGNQWLWCMGFVQTILDQAFSEMSLDFQKLMPRTYSCDLVGTHGIANNCLMRNKNLKHSVELIKPGDIFLLSKSLHDWNHTGIIVEINFPEQTIVTIEGNTNHGGSRNGNGVYKRVRNFHSSNIDVFSIESFARQSDGNVI